MGITNRYQILIAAKLAKEVEGFRGAQTIQGSALMFRFSSECANYSREQTVQGGILIKEIWYLHEIILEL